VILDQAAVVKVKIEKLQPRGQQFSFWIGWPQKSTKHAKKNSGFVLRNRFFVILAPFRG
jgi:hypothetical protein